MDWIGGDIVDDVGGVHDGVKCVLMPGKRNAYVWYSHNSSHLGVQLSLTKTYTGRSVSADRHAPHKVLHVEIALEARGAAPVLERILQHRGGVAAEDVEGGNLMPESACDHVRSTCFNISVGSW